MTQYNVEEQVVEERSLGDLFSELSREVRTLVRQEVQLAKAELSQEASRVGTYVALLAIGGFILYAGFLALMLAAIYGLAEVMSPWVAALIVAIVVGAAGAILLWWAWDRLKEVNLVPDRTVETVQEDAQWLKQQVQ